MRISDWSSDVCSSDLADFLRADDGQRTGRRRLALSAREQDRAGRGRFARLREQIARGDGVADRQRHREPAARHQNGGDVGEREPGAALRLRHQRSEEHTSELQSLMRTSYAVFCLKNKKEDISMKQVTIRMSHETMS